MVSVRERTELRVAYVLPRRRTWEINMPPRTQGQQGLSGDDYLPKEKHLLLQACVSQEFSKSMAAVGGKTQTRARQGVSLFQPAVCEG